MVEKGISYTAANLISNFRSGTTATQNKYEHSTIDSHMTAISAYHNLVEEPVGQGILVCNLMTDVFNKNPPNSKYIFIWDVEKVKLYPLIQKCQIELYS